MRTKKSISSNQTTIIPKPLVISHTYNLKQLFKYIETSLNDSISLLNQPFTKNNFYIYPSLRVKFVNNQIDESTALYVSSNKKLFLMDSFGTRLYAKFKDINFNLDQLPILLDKLSLEKTHSQEGDYFFITRDWQGNPLPIYANNGDINSSFLDQETTASLKLSLRYIYNNISFALNSSSAKYIPDNFTLPINSTSFNLINFNTTKEKDSPSSQSLFNAFKIDTKLLYLGGTFIAALGLAYSYYRFHQRANALSSIVTNLIIEDLHITSTSSQDTSKNSASESDSTEIAVPIDKTQVSTAASEENGNELASIETNSIADFHTVSTPSRDNTPNIDDRLTPIITSFSDSDLGPDSTLITPLSSGVKVTPLTRGDFVAISEYTTPNSYGSYEMISQNPTPIKPQVASKEAIDKALSRFIYRFKGQFDKYLEEFKLLSDSMHQIHSNEITEYEMKKKLDQAHHNKKIINMFGIDGFVDIYESRKNKSNEALKTSIHLPELTEQEVEYIFKTSINYKESYIRYLVKAITLIITAEAIASVPRAEAIDSNESITLDSTFSSKTLDLMNSVYEKVSGYVEVSKTVSKSIICRGISYSVATFTYEKTNIIDGKTKAIDLTTNALCNYAIDLVTSFRLPSSKTIAKDTKEVAVATTCYEVSNRLAENSDDHLTKFAIYMTTPSICNLMIEGSDKALEMVGEISSL